jgi:hypothetical protein
MKWMDIPLSLDDTFASNSLSWQKTTPKVAKGMQDNG